MDVFVVGGTGVAGRRALRSLVRAGHRVTASVRSYEKAQLVRDLGSHPVQIDPFDGSAVREALEGQEAIVNLATKIPPLSRAPLPGAWSENARIRREVSRNLVDAGLAVGATRYVQESLAFMYPDSGDHWIDEDLPPDPAPHARTTLDAEGNTARFNEAGGVGIVLRFGQFYAPDATHFSSWLSIARRGWSPFLGPPEAFSPFVHAEDVGEAVAIALRAPAGVYNVVDDEPLRQREVAAAYADSLGLEPLSFPPSAVARLGGSKVRMLMRSQRVSNTRFRTATGWEPRFPNVREGFDSVAKEALVSPRAGARKP